MAKISPGKFVREVRQETAKVTWPSRQETIVSTIMVFIMVVLAALFFLLVDKIVGWVLKSFLGIG